MSIPAISKDSLLDSRVDPLTGATLELLERSAGWRVAGAGERWQEACYVVRVSQGGVISVSMARQYPKLSAAGAAFDAGTIHGAA